MTHLTIEQVDHFLELAASGVDASGIELDPVRREQYIDMLLDRRLRIMFQRSGASTGSKSP
ncbi:hypothetical protein K8O93_00945 [Gordonia bronchialis]|uniref:hypothetical protein n=1 Tax=Gordonia bronchialis TaxID=2054 RepID=UPI001CBF8376|nr:hypothetical protein [Gordonia bronchialis]UAK38400.1 hypothetical protein K8O93_00945 [Gordonia bronchialis]